MVNRWDKQNAFEATSQFLRIIYEQIALGTADRITLYKHLKPKSAFWPIGRYTRNPVTVDISSRQFYPDNQGFIAKGWKDNIFFVEDLPDPKDNFDAYYDAVNRLHQIDKNALNAMRMKSRAYFVQNLLSPSGYGLAIIVIESCNEKTLNKIELSIKLDKVQDNLVNFINLHPFEPEPDSSLLGDYYRNLQA